MIIRNSLLLPLLALLLSLPGCSTFVQNNVPQNNRSAEPVICIEKTLINTCTTTSQINPEIALLSNGTFVVIWETLNDDSSSGNISGQLFDANGTRIGDTFQICSYEANYQNSIKVKALENEGFVVTWDSWTQINQDNITYGQMFNAKADKKGGIIPITMSDESNLTSPLFAQTSKNYVAVYNNDQLNSECALY